MTKALHVPITVSTPKECSLGLAVSLGEMSAQVKEPEVSEETSIRSRKGVTSRLAGGRGSEPLGG